MEEHVFFHMTTAALAVGYLLDLLLGDPQALYHPVRVIGSLIQFLEKGIRRLFPKSARGELVGGAVLAVLVCACSVAVPYALCRLAFRLHPAAGFALTVLWCWQIPATRSLAVESGKVYDALKKGDLPGARYAVSMIVGRDTAQLDEEGVVKAAVETVAENTSDGVAAPLLFLALGGPAAGFFYKAVNTMDSMIGYRNDAYLYFGRCAARLDDLVNFIPARVSAWLMLCACALCRMDTAQAWKIYARDRKCHASPNSAQTESVMAGALRVQLAGDASYFGKLVKKSVIGDSLRPVEPEDIHRAHKLLYGTSWLTFLLAMAIRMTLSACL